MVQKRFRKRMGVVRQRATAGKGKTRYVPGIGGSIGRLAKVGMGYVSKGGMAYKALRLARKVANAVNIEYKINDTLANGTTFDYAGTMVTVNNPAQGSTDVTRIGDSIKCQNLMLRFLLTRGAGDSTGRVIVFWDDQNQISTGANLLEVTGTASSVLSPKLYDARFRSKVLYDKVFVMDQVNQSTWDENVQIKIDQHTQFNAGSTTINTGALKVLFISNITGANIPTVNYYSRLSFTDN